MNVIPTGYAKSSRIESPCVRICDLIGSTCQGCGRTRPEIASYGSASDAQRQRINANAQRRMATLTRKTVVRTA